MSKAWINENQMESDLDQQEEIPEPQIPKGQKNYITRQGFKRLQEEVQHLLNKVRPEITATVAWAASNGDRSENADYLYGKKKLREIDRRVRFLTKRLEVAEVVDPKENACDRVYFGSTVDLRDEEGQIKTYTIVGVDEIDLDKGRISWVSPLARAILKAQAGDIISFKSPKGIREMEILDIRYESTEEPSTPQG